MGTEESELLGAFHASVELERGGSGEAVEAGWSVRRRMWEEEELVVSPEYFYGLRAMSRVRHGKWRKGGAGTTR